MEEKFKQMSEHLIDMMSQNQNEEDDEMMKSFTASMHKERYVDHHSKTYHIGGD